jgi:proteasome lid subunit RPN8/RPN11
MMEILITQDLLDKIQQHGETTYPDEGAGLLLGRSDSKSRRVESILTLTNAREASARHNRYLITPQDMMQGENHAMGLGLEIIGVFHSHPDHPNRPSDFDKEWAMPWFSYIITSVQKGKSSGSRSWRLSDDRDGFSEEKITITTE